MLNIYTADSKAKDNKEPAPPKKVKTEFLLYPEKVWHSVNKRTNRICTTVEWRDGTKTTVEDKTGVGDEFTGFCCAVAKKIFANKTYRLMETYEEALQTKPLHRELKLDAHAVQDVMALLRNFVSSSSDNFDVYVCEEEEEC